MTARATNLASGRLNLTMMTRIMTATTRLGSILMVRVAQPLSLFNELSQGLFQA